MARNLKKNKIEVHAGSIFLQGLINLKEWPKYFKKWESKLPIFIMRYQN